MERLAKTQLPGGVGALDEAMRDHIVLFRCDKWSDARGMVPAAAWNPARLPAHALAIYPRC